METRGVLLTSVVLMASILPAAGQVPPTNPSAQAPDGNNAPLVKSVNMRLPLTPTEYLAPFENGCALVFDTRFKVDITGWKWFGACPFGVAHGKGVTQRQDGSAYNDQYWYGFDIVNVAAQRESNHYFSNYEYSFPLYSVAVPNESSIELLQHQKVLSFREMMGLDQPYVRHSFRSGSLACPFKSIPETAPVRNPDYAKSAKAACSQAKKQNTDRAAPITIRYVVQVREAVTWAGSVLPSTPQSPNRVIENIAICSVVQDGSDCTAQLRILVAPYRARMDAVINGDQAAKDNARANFVARFRPIEDAFIAKARQMLPLITARREAAKAALPPVQPPVVPTN